MYTIYSLQLHELHEYNFSNHPWNLFAQLNNDPRFFFTVEGAKLRDQVAAHFHFWCLKRKRKVAEGNCKRVQWGAGQAAREENSQSARRIDFLRINNFLPRAQSWRAVTKYRPRKKVGRETLTRRARFVRPSVHLPHPRSAKLIFDPLELKLTKMVFTANLADENNSSNIQREY